MGRIMFPDCNFVTVGIIVKIVHIHRLIGFCKTGLNRVVLKGTIKGVISFPLVRDVKPRQPFILFLLALGKRKEWENRYWKIALAMLVLLRPLGLAIP